MTTSQGQVEVGGTPIRFRESGSGSVAVILDDGVWGIAPLHEPLAARCRVVRLDLAGFAGMSPESAPKSAGDLAALVAQAIGEITADKYTLIGASSGATVALRQTLLAPDSVEALVLLSPIAVLPTGDSSAAGNQDAEVEARMEEIACATLAMFGVNDRMAAPEAARVYRERIPNSNISLVYDAGHALLSDRPEAVIGAVTDFVERRETFIVGRESGVINP